MIAGLQPMHAVRQCCHSEDDSAAQGYAGDEQLGEALKGADVIIIPAGVPRKPGMTRDDLFKVLTLCQLFIAPLCLCRKLRLASLHALLSAISHIEGQYVRVIVLHADQRKHCEGSCSSCCRACAWGKSLLPAPKWLLTAACAFGSAPEDCYGPRLSLAPIPPCNTVVG